MKQIFVGSTQRTSLYSKIRETLLIPLCIQLGIIALLVIIPICFEDKIFNEANGSLSPVVKVETYTGTGSAIYIGNQRLLTAAHVVAGMSNNEVCDIQFIDPNDVDGNTSVLAQARLLCMGKYLPDEDPSEDYALLEIFQVDADNITKACPLGPDMPTTSAVTVEGFPGGAYSNTPGTIINVTGGVTQIKDLYVSDAKAWHGNSGGAMFNANNQLIGIVIAGGAIDGINDGQTYALKITKVKKDLAAKGFQL